MEKSLGEIIVNRSYILNNTTINLFIGKPQPYINDYYCPYLIEGINSDEIKYIYGIDSLQALQLALKIISVEINLLKDKYDNKISWLGGEEGDTGFPD